MPDHWRVGQQITVSTLRNIAGPSAHLADALHKAGCAHCHFGRGDGAQQVIDVAR
ncbi:hypothetical protein N6L24_08345 [Cognatishimia sp. SS12]|uniref:hypothetical protein n=1 Tax=Cognatishimia sp. SS12 TaxID=2979465 RepID=UPI0023312322|nr:hypothetical protein [Cognatishimia sp. SS12]MDC0738288.1 hypothetical protein [Cognatishimia sp. SS12]